MERAAASVSRRKTDRLDEDDVRIRPGKHKTRPRSKTRPGHEDAQRAIVTTVDRGRFTLLDESGCQHYAVKARELGRKGVVVGDAVEAVGLAGETTTERAEREDFARIVRRLPRATVLRRTADDVDPIERVIVANADQLAVVTSTTDPEPRTGLIDRALVAAFDAGIKPMLFITKSDLGAPTALVEAYAPLDIPIIEAGVEVSKAGLLEHITHHTTVLVGHSGVGKSTLVNALVPGADRSTGVVNEVTGKGRHTSTNVIALPLPAGGIVIDTPGIRSFGLAHVDANRVIHAFSDLAQAAEACPRGCSHHEPFCALDDAVTEGTVPTARVESLRRLLTSKEETGY
jgi:ribosome biogenesis GTPase